MIDLLLAFDCIQGKNIRSNGYAHIGDERAHRHIWKQHFGEIPVGYVIHHVCENKACVNLAHLECLTRRDHNARHRPRCSHPESERRFGTDGRLRCRACRREDEKARYESDSAWRDKRKELARERQRKVRHA